MALPEPYYHDEKAGITIYCGDARDVVSELDSVDLILTDPPYGHNNNNDDLIARRELVLGGKEAMPTRPIANDGCEANELVQWLFAEAARLLQPGHCCCCCCGGGGPDPQFARWSLWMDEHLQFKQMVVWDKGPMGMGWHYRRSYETVLVGEKPGAACRWFGGRITENIIRPGYFGRKIIPSESEHPTAKPVQLMKHFIRLHTEVGEIVLDPFCGHGATLEAAKLERRQAIGVELDESFCAKAANRLAQGVLPFTD